MINQKIFSKGERIHALITNTMHSNIMFPVMAVIHDVEFTSKIPRYQIRITKFYDDLNFLKRYLFNMTYEKDFEGRRTKFKLKRGEYSKMEDFQNLLDSSGDKYKVVVDSPMCLKTKGEIFILFNKIQDFLIESKIKELYEFSTRTSYKGTYSYASKGVFEIHLKKFLGNREKPIKDFYDSLLYRPNMKDLDNIE